jgi:hypothetical protein
VTPALTIWSTETVPADLNDERDGRDLPTGLTLERGSVIRITDMLPGKKARCTAPTASITASF